jgi:MOSC domain-containing protein YiiM
MSTLEQILIAASPSHSMVEVDHVMAIPGKGLVGDRYFEGNGTFSPQPQKPDFEVTLMELEQIESFAKSSQLLFTAFQARRNLIVQGVDLNACVGKEFQIGSVRFRGIRLCEPCNYLAKITFPEVLPGLVHKGGLRAQILCEGVLRRGDAFKISTALNPDE